jgi:hypothetical protein
MFLAFAHVFVVCIALCLQCTCVLSLRVVEDWYPSYNGTQEALPLTADLESTDRSCAPAQEAWLVLLLLSSSTGLLVIDLENPGALELSHENANPA